jgi:oligo-1,6-glucosidase/alpha-glucosidase
MNSINSHCDALPWWKRTTVYQIYPRSFADRDGDGIGDLAGIIDRLDYLEWLGIETIWLSPFFTSPQADFGYDISDHFNVAPEYGSLEECRRLFDEIHARGMKVVLDMVLNHTSDQHPWFLESRSSRDNPYRDFYMWRDGRKPNGAAPPNNWQSMLGGSGWNYDPQTDQWYWSSFLPFQPDLNYRRPAVKRAMLDVVRHWLRAGADGLRLDIFNAIYKDASFADNPRSLRFVSEDNPGGFFQRALHTQNHPDTFAFARELRAVVDEFEDPQRFVVGEVFGPPELLRQYCGPSGDGLNLVFLFKSLRTPFRAPAFRELVRAFESVFAEPFHPTYVFGNHDRPRHMERLGDDPRRARLLAAFQMTVRGVPFIYYGDELGLSHHHGMPREAARDPMAARFGFIPKLLLPWLRRRGILINRDECRSPMPWQDGPHAGFAPPGTSATWLPLHPQSATKNVAVQTEDSGSVLSTYRRMLHLRRSSPALSSGRLELFDAPTDPKKVLAYRRIYEDANVRETAEVFLNFSDQNVRLDLGNLRSLGGVRIHSNLHDETSAPAQHHVLRAWEAAVILRDHCA